MKLKLLKRIILNKGALWLSYIKLIPVLRRLNKNSLVIDCGANTGDITKKFADTGATVHAFEPDPLAYEFLKKRFEKNPGSFFIAREFGISRLKLFCINIKTR